LATKRRLIATKSDIALESLQQRAAGGAFLPAKLGAPADQFKLVEILKKNSIWQVFSNATSTLCWLLAGGVLEQRIAMRVEKANTLEGDFTRRPTDLPLNFHPAAIRASADFTPSGVV
jgi:hypothetical protein